MKCRYDEDEQEILWETVKNDHVIVDPKGEFVAQIIDDLTLDEVIKTYPKNKEKLIKLVGADKKTMGGKISFIEYHTPEFTVWKYQNIILDKQKNPNWDWGETTTVDEFGVETPTSYNVLKKPSYPYIFFKS